MRYEYYFLCLASTDGVAAVEQVLNALAREGWRLTPIVLPGNWGILERPIPAQSN